MAKSKREQNIDMALIQQVNAENKYSKDGAIETLPLPKNQNTLDNKKSPVKFKTLVMILVALLIILFFVVLVIAAIQYIIK